MRWIVLSLFLLSSLLLAEEMGKKWETNENCEACHMNISSKWETSRHANSHFTKNDLFKKSLQYMVLKNPSLILDEVKVECAQCHNPRISKSTMSKEDKVSVILDHKEKKNEYQKMMNTKNMKNGINCVVCHNINEIHLDKVKGSQGMNSVTFGAQGTMFGPFGDAKSPYHKTAQRDHFKGDNPTLCFACHYSGKNAHGIEVYATGKEYDMFAKDKKGSVEGCKSCHMSAKQKGNASNYAKVGEKPKERMVREHRFASVDNSNIIDDYISVKSKVKSGKFVITLKNESPHMIPTGYGLREIILKVTFLDKKDKVLSTKKYILGTKWKDKRGEMTIPHLAVSKTKDTRQKGKSSSNYAFPIPKDAQYAKYSFSYRLIGEDLAKKIGISDEFFLREYTFLEKRVHL